MASSKKKILLVIMTLMIIQRSNSALVLTKFNQLNSYASKLIAKEGFQTDNTIPVPHDRKLFCLGLLSARIFERADNDEMRNIIHSISNCYFTIPYIKLMYLLSKKCEKQLPRRRSCVIENEIISLSSVECVTYNESMGWVATYDRDLHTGLLFLKGNTIDLIALIDRKVKMEGKPQNALRISFMDTIEIKDTSQGESLCHLKKNSIFRICSICADALLGTISEHQYTFSVNRNESKFSCPYNNYLFFRSGTDICPLKKIHVDHNINVKHYALYCDISVKGNPYPFYLKLKEDVRETSLYSVFIMLPDDNSNNVKLRDEIEIHQLKSIMRLDRYIRRT